MDLAAKELRKISSQELDSGLDGLFQQYWTPLCHLLYRLTGDWDEAEDLTLDVFLRWHRQPPDRQDQPGSWLYRVGTNLALNALRSKKRRLRYELQGELARSGEDPAELAESRMERERVRLALAELKPRSAQILILRHSGFSYSEIADILKVAPSSVGALLARASTEFEGHYRRLEGEGG